MLRERHVNKRIYRAAQTLIAAVLRDAYHLHGALLLVVMHFEVTSDGIPIRPEFLRRRLVDHRNVLRIRFICIGEFTSPQKRDAHVLKIAGRHVVVVDRGRSLAGGRLEAFDIQSRDRIVVTHGNRKGQAGRLHAGQRTPASQHLMVKGGRLLVVVPDSARVHRHVGETLGLEPEIYVLGFGHAPCEEHRDHQQHERAGNLHGHQCIPQTMVACGDGAA